MERKVKICTLCAMSAQGAAEYLEQRLSACSLMPQSEDFGDAAAFAARAADLAADGGIVVAAAPLNMFLNAKLRLLKAFSFKMVRSSTVASLMGENAPQNPKERDLHAAVPQKSKAFPTRDGLYSAFAAKDGDALVVFLPLEEEMLKYLFETGVEQIFTGELKAAVASAPKTKKQELKERIDSVIASGKTVAVSPCGSSKMLLSAISAVEGSELAFYADSYAAEKGEGISDAEYIAECARASKENAGKNLGIAISEIYNDGSGDEDFVIVCVADSERAKAAKVYAKPGEDKKLLIVAAIIKLCQMLDELSGPAGLVNPNPPVAAPKKWSRNPKTPLLVAIIAIAVAIIICIIVAFVLSGKEDDATLTYAEQNPYVQQGGTLAEDNNYFDYQGGSALEFEDLGAVAIEPETSTLSFISTAPTTMFSQTTLPKTTLTQKVTKVLTTIEKTTKVLTTKSTTTKPITTVSTTVTTTRKMTTTATTAVPTTVATTVGTTSTVSGDGGTFVFRVYGYGHGVGMSQEGAIQMAKDGSTYDKILTHYFAGTTVQTDSATPATVKYGGKDIPLVEYLCRTAKPEIGPSAPLEALKAQIVSAYTFAKYYNFDVAKSKHVYDSGYAYEGTNVHKACLAVLGMESDADTPSAKYIDYNGSAAFTCYFASSAGKTASASSVWGGNQYPYLTGGISSPEDIDVSTVEISAADMKKYIESYDEDNSSVSITLSDDPSEWLEIISHDSAYNEKTGYVNEIRVGNCKLRGNAFRSYVVDFKIRSHCFALEYIPE